MQLFPQFDLLSFLNSHNFICRRKATQKHPCDIHVLQNPHNGSIIAPPQPVQEQTREGSSSCYVTEREHKGSTHRPPAFQGPSRAV